MDGESELVDEGDFELGQLGRELGRQYRRYFKVHLCLFLEE